MHKPRATILLPQAGAVMATVRDGAVRDGAVRKARPKMRAEKKTKILVSKPVRAAAAMATVAAPAAPSPVPDYAAAFKQARFTVDGPDWPDALAATLPALGSDDCIRLVFMDGAHELLDTVTDYTGECWIPHSVLLFGDRRPVHLGEKALPLIAWMLRNDFLSVRASYADSEDNALAYQQASAGMPWARSAHNAVLATGGQRLGYPGQVEFDAFLDFLDYALEQDAQLASRLAEARLFSTVPLEG